MKLYGYEFENEGTVQFQPISGVLFSDLNIDGYSAIPEGTHLIWEYSTDGGVTWDAGQWRLGPGAFQHRYG